MDTPIQRDGMWWQQWEGRWLRWNPQSDGWEEQAGAPPPPPAPAPVAAQPVRAYAGSGASAASLDAGETWSTVRIAPAAQPYVTPSSHSAARSRPPVGAVVGGVLAVALAVGAYLFFFTGPAGPSAEDIDGAFAPLEGYTYQQLPEAVSETITEQVEQNEDVNELIGEFDFRAVVRGGRTVGAVAIMGFDPDDYESMNEQQFAYGFEQGSGISLPGTSVKTVERAGTKMYEVAVPGAAAVVFVDESDGMVFSIAMNDAASARAVSEQLAASNL